MARFLSTVTNKIDAKGRVSVPAPFRAVAVAQGFAGVYCYSSFNEAALDGGGADLVDELQSMIDEIDPFSEEYDALATALLGGAHALSFDQDGRIHIPDQLLDYAHITESVSFVGLGRKFQMWQPEAFAERDARLRKLARESRGLLRARGRRSAPGGEG